MSKRKTPSYNEAQVNHWLTWLAKNMKQHDQTVFLLENLQPSWLQTRSEVRTYAFIKRMLWSVWAGLIFGLIFGLIDTRRLDTKRSIDTLLINPTLPQFIIGILRIALIVGLIAWLIVGPIVGLVFAPIIGPTFGLDGFMFGPIVRPISGLDGLMFGLIFGLIYTSRETFRTPSAAIRPVEVLRWSRAAAKRSTFQGLIIGPIAGYNDLISVLITGLIYGLIFGLFGFFIIGFAPALRDLKTESNQGIWLSRRNAVQIGGLGGLALGLFAALFIGHNSLDAGLACGMLSAMALGMWFGGFEVVEHSILRLILWRKGYAPLNYAEFLDYAAEELNFLQKVGGGYIFIHRYLLEYFADMADEPVAPAESAGQTVAAGDD